MTRKFTFLILAFLAVAITSVPGAMAQDRLDAPITAEVIQGWQLPDGRRVTALRLNLEPGWKTYWRAPGDAGIPPHFDWRRARNISDVEVTWPTPSVYFDNGMRSIGYTDQVVIPMHVTPKTPGKPVRLRTRMSLGVCSDVCMPYELDIDATLDSDDLTPTPAIVAALTDTPYSQSEAGVRDATCRLRPTKDGMEIEARITLPHTGGTEAAVIETATDGLWISEPVTRRQGDTIIAVSELVHADGSAFAIDRSDVRITIFGSNHSVDVRGCAAG